jgi:hypothetical protein
MPDFPPAFNRANWKMTVPVSSVDAGNANQDSTRQPSGRQAARLTIPSGDYNSDFWLSLCLSRALIPAAVAFGREGNDLQFAHPALSATLGL